MNKSSPHARIRPWIQGVLLVGFAGASLFGVLAFSAMVIFSRLNGEQPASLRSPLHANYGVDDRALAFQALNFNLVEQAIREQITGTINANDRITTVIGQLKTSVPTITPHFSITPVFTASPTQTEPGLSATDTLRVLSPTGTRSGLNTQTLTPTLVSGSMTPTSLVSATITRTATFTSTPSSKAPTSTLAPGITSSVMPVPTRTAQPTAIPTYTTRPSFTLTQTQVPTFAPTHTPVPTKPHTSTHTPVPYPPPHTSTPVPTSTLNGTAYP